jgi:hypothetical protein
LKNINCQNCKNEISKAAPTCPNCGHPNKQANYLPGWMVWLTFAGIGLFIWWQVEHPDTETASASVPPSSIEAAPALSTQKPAVQLDGPVEISASLKEDTALMLNLNNHLCAKVVEFRPLRVKNTYEVTCVAYRNGTATKVYVLDANTGSAWEP